MACLFFFVLFSVTQTDSTAPVQPQQPLPVSLWWLLVAAGQAGDPHGLPQVTVPGSELWFSFLGFRVTWKKMDIVWEGKQISPCPGCSGHHIPLFSGESSVCSGEKPFQGQRRLCCALAWGGKG